ncbi:alpha/beta-hydrolase [Xylariaceae sp. FL0255]|nr:alpha/beta-hydrolase [Xylariaceae sp. FL0255]
MATGMQDFVAAGGPATVLDEIKPYKIHVSSRYLDLTKQKLEITRLPHEIEEPRSRDWWQPKSHVEPLIDFWLEQYQWREQEEAFNNELPQFRTGFAIPYAETSIRLHFIHVRSSHQNAIPLLLIPPFPFTNLSLGHLVKPFTEPDDVANNQPFHLVIPSLPGLGFSDALPTNSAVISTTADMLDLLMKRLDYPHYLVTNSGTATASPAEIDYKLVEYLSIQYSDSCLGTHFISPPLAQPKIQEAPLEWAKWSIASFFEAPILGYRTEDFSALRHNGYTPSSKKSATPKQFGLNRLGLTEPNTLAYALCDSPTGLLVFAMKGLRTLAPQKQFTPTEIINFAQLAWLPGPEAAMRFWAHCSQHPEKIEKKKKSTTRPWVSVTVFLGKEQQGATNLQGENVADVEVTIPKLPSAGEHAYSCPSWARTKYNVLHANRASGTPGLLAWERPEIIAAGVRGLASALLKIDQRLKPEGGRPAPVPLQQVTVATPSAEGDFTSFPSGPATPAADNDLLAPPSSIAQRLQPSREISDDTKVASDENLVTIAGKTPSPIPSPSPVYLAEPTASGDE